MNKLKLKNLKINRWWLITGIIILISGYLILSFGLDNTIENRNFLRWNEMMSPVFIVLGYFLIGIAVFNTKNY